MTPALILVFFANLAFSLAVGIALMVRLDSLEERIEDLETYIGPCNGYPVDSEDQ